MTQQLSLLTLAKQGNADAIAALMNRSLQVKGIAAKASLKDGCLQVMLESAQVPEQEAVVEFVRKGVTGLEAEPIKAVKVYGRRVGEDFPTWEREFEIKNTSDDSVISMLSTSGLLQANTSSSKHTLKSQSRNRQQSKAYPRTYLFPFNVIILLSFLSIGIAALVFVASRSSINPSPQSQAAKASQAEAKQNIKAINRAQQAFYLEKDAFAPTVAVLDIGISSETASYDYISNVDQTKAISVAIAKVNGLKSYVGAVFAVKTTDGLNITVAGTCVTDKPLNKPLRTPPNLPQLIGQDIKCPSDSFDVSR